MLEFLQNNNIETAIVPKNISGTATDGDWVSLRNYKRATIVLVGGSWAGGTSAITLEQARNTNGLDAKTLAFDTRYTKVGQSSANWTITTVTSNTFTQGVANTLNVIEIDALDLDVDGGFDCLQVKSASPGSNADYLCVLYILSEPRYGCSINVMPDGKSDLIS